MLDEAFGVGEVGSVKDGLAMGEDTWCLTMMQPRRDEEADAGVVVLFVIPVEEVDGESGRPGWSRSGLGSPAGTSRYGTGFPSRGYRLRRVDGCASW